MSFEMDTSSVNAVARIKLLDLCSIKFVPRPVLKLQKTWDLQLKGLALRAVYEVPIDSIDTPWAPPARIMLRCVSSSNNTMARGALPLSPGWTTLEGMACALQMPAWSLIAAFMPVARVACTRCCALLVVSVFRGNIQYSQAHKCWTCMCAIWASRHSGNNYQETVTAHRIMMTVHCRGDRAGQCPIRCKVCHPAALSLLVGRWLWTPYWAHRVACRESHTRVRYRVAQEKNKALTMTKPAADARTSVVWRIGNVGWFEGTYARDVHLATTASVGLPTSWGQNSHTLTNQSHGSPAKPARNSVGGGCVYHRVICSCPLNISVRLVDCACCCVKQLPSTVITVAGRAMGASMTVSIDAWSE